MISRAGIEPTTLRLHVRLRYHYAIETTPLATDYMPSFVYIYLLAYNVYPSLDPVYFFEAYIGASR